MLSKYHELIVQYLSIPVTVDGYISVFAHGRGRAIHDRQFFYVNGRPCGLPKVNHDATPRLLVLTLNIQVQKAINDVYKTFNTNQYPFVVANLSLPLGMPSYFCKQDLLLINFVKEPMMLMFPRTKD